MVDVITCIENSKVVIVKLAAIIWIDHSRYAKPVYNILPHKALHFSDRDGGERFRLHPISKVVDDDS